MKKGFEETGHCGPVCGEFKIVGIRPQPPVEPECRPRWYQGKPMLSAVLLLCLVAACLADGLVMAKDPVYMDLGNCSAAPSREFLFGTDTMGRDIFSMIWHGGRTSLAIGAVSALISTGIAILYGAASGCVPVWADALLMRLAELLISVPNLLVAVLLQATLGEANIASIALVIGITSWMGMAKMIRTEVRQIRGSEYVLAAKGMGGSFFYRLYRHLAPNFVPSIMFMAVMNVRNAIVAESTLSFMGIGLPVKEVSWGSMLSLSEQALLTNAWWIVVIPGVFLTGTLLCITNLGNCLRKSINRKQSNLS